MSPSYTSAPDLVSAKSDQLCRAAVSLCALSSACVQAIGGYRKKPSTKLLMRVHRALAGGTLEHEIDGEDSPDRGIRPCLGQGRLNPGVWD